MLELPKLGEFAFYCRWVRQKGYCFALPITASMLRRRQWAVGGAFPRSAKKVIRRALPGHTLYSTGQQSSQLTDEFRPSGVVGPARGTPRLNINERLLRGNRDWGLVLTWSLAIPLSRRFRLILSLDRVRSWYWTLRLAAAASYLIVGSRYGLVSDVTFGGGCVISYRRFAPGVGFGRYHK